MKTQEAYVPYIKMSKKAQKEYNSKKRNSWGELSPVTRIVPNKKIYSRQAFKLDERAGLKYI